MTSDTTQLKRLQGMFDAQKASVAREPYPSLEQRLERLATLRTMFAENLQLFRDTLAEDFGRIPPRMVDILETEAIIYRVAFFEANLAEWMKPQEIPVARKGGTARARILRLPKGVNGNIAPWNFAVESAFIMCADMLAAGNTAIVKPSELAPATAQALDESVTKYFDPEVLAVVQGGPELAAAFSAMPWDHLTFTGSPRVGQIVMEAAAKNLVPVTLELGGKNPALFAADGVTEDLVDRMFKFREMKAGQVCTSPDYAMVPRDRLEDWVTMAGDCWRRTYPTYVGHPFATSIINDAHFERLVGYLDEARTRGVRVVSLNGEEPDPKLRQIPLTLVVDPPEDLGCMTDEIFGPVLPVVPYDAVDEAMARINAGPSPLGSYIATANEELAERFLHTVRSGGGGVNNFGSQGGSVNLPFGGIGRSGQGCHSGYEGFLNYSHTKSVFYGDKDPASYDVLGPLPSDLKGREV